VSAERAAGTSRYKGTTYYFCNPNCKKAFDADPEKYLEQDEQVVGKQGS
jgi:Cu+-exporting ATPase